MERVLETVPCNLCQRQDTKKIFQFTDNDIAQVVPVNDYTLVQCNHCSLTYLNPRLRKKWLNRFYEQYFSNQFTHLLRYYDNSFRIKKAITEIKTLRKYLKKGTLIDIGSGGGYFLRVAKRNGFTVLGVDSTKSVSHYAKKFNLPIIMSEFLQAKLPFDHFDGVVMLDTLEHLQDPLKNLRKVRSILKKRGILYIKVPNQTTGLINPTIHLPLARHLYYFSPKTLTMMLRKAGFRILHLSTINDPYSPAVKLSFLDHVKPLFNKGRYIQVIAIK